MGLVRPAALLLLSASVVAAPDCPAGTTAMGSTPGGEWAVCEATARRDGGLVYTHRNGSVVEIEKTAEALFGCGERGPVPEDATAGCNASIDNPTYLAQLNGAEPSYSAMKGFLPPMVYDGGYNKMDPVHFHGSRDPAQDGAGHFNVHTWTGSRSSSTDAAFDSNGADISEMGYPTMNQFTGKYGRSSAVFKNSIETLGQKEGLWGGCKHRTVTVRMPAPSLLRPFLPNRAAHRHVPLQGQGRRRHHQRLRLRQAAPALPLARRPHLLPLKPGAGAVRYALHKQHRKQFECSLDRVDRLPRRRHAGEPRSGCFLPRRQVRRPARSVFAMRV